MENQTDPLADPRAANGGDPFFPAPTVPLAALLKRSQGDPLTDDEQAAWNAYQAQLEEAEARRSALSLVRLGDVMEGGDTEPEMLAVGLLVRAMHHVIYGTKESGKTWLLLVTAAQLVARGETVVWVDEEMGRRDLANRLKTLAADPDVVNERFVYLEYPALDGSSGSRALWAMLLEAKRPALVVVDAQTEVLAAADLNENLGTDVAKWNSWYLSPARAIGAATAFIDHTGHDTSGRPVGSRHKGAQSKVELEVTRVKRFSVNSVGVIKVRETKNTPSADIASEQFFELGGKATGDDTFEFVFRRTGKPGVQLTDKTEAMRRQKIEAKVRGADRPLSKTEIHGLTGGKKQAVLNTIDSLIEEGSLVAQDGKRGLVYTWSGSKEA
jgi:AAA domain